MSTPITGTLYVIFGASIRALLDSGEPEDELRRGFDLAMGASRITSPTVEAAGKAFVEIVRDELNMQ